MATPQRPTAAALRAARDKKVADLLVPNLKVLFCGINPGLYSAAVGHHFARPGNRFWPTLHAAGFTPHLLTPAQERELLPLGYGITNIVHWATATADELTADELMAGAKRLEKKVHRYQPRFVAFVGVTAYRTAFQRKHAKMGRQSETMGNSALWILPNPSGLNAHYGLADFACLFAELRSAAES